MVKGKGTSNAWLQDKKKKLLKNLNIYNFIRRQKEKNIPIFYILGIKNKKYFLMRKMENI